MDCVHYPDPPKNSGESWSRQIGTPYEIASWYNTGNYRIKADVKHGQLSCDETFEEEILSHFTPPFEPVKRLAESFRITLNEVEAKQKKGKKDGVKEVGENIGDVYDEIMGQFNSVIKELSRESNGHA